MNPEETTIVIIEDETILRELMDVQLQKHGYKVLSADDGEVGWNLIQETKPALILLDLLMPIMSGYDVLLKLRKHPELKDVPCIVISNSGQMDDLNRAYQCGANDVLIKADFNPDELVKKIATQLAPTPAAEKSSELKPDKKDL